MSRRSIPIEEKIEAQKELVSKAKDRYEKIEIPYPLPRVGSLFFHPAVLQR